MKWYWIVVCILAYKVISNLAYMLEMVHYKKLYRKWFENHLHNFSYHAIPALKLLKRANIPDSHIAMSEALNRRQILNSKVSIFNNITIQHPYIANAVIDKFDMAIGVYKSRIIETFNPIYWIDFIIFAPKKLIKYFGFDLEKHVTKIVNILLTAIWWGFGIIFTTFHEQIKIFIINLLEVLT